MSRFRRFGWWFLAAAWGLGCGILTPLRALVAVDRTPVPVNAPATVQAAVQATLRAAGSEPTLAAPTAAPTMMPATPPSPTPAPLSGPRPAYVWAYEEDAGRYTLYDAYGQAVLTWPPAPEAGAPASILHLDGPVPQDGNWTGRRVFYWSSDIGGQGPAMQGLVAVNLLNGTVQSYMQLADTGVLIFPVALAGKPAAPQVALSLLYNPGRQYESRLFRVDPLASSDVVALLQTMTHPNGRVLAPVGVSDAGVWFTHAVWGAPVLPTGLYLHHQGQETTLLDDAHTLLAFEPGRGLVVASPAPNQIAWQVVDLQSGVLLGPAVQVTEPVFSGDVRPLAAAIGERYVAWQIWVGPLLEGQGYLRVYTRAGDPVAVATANDPLAACVDLMGCTPRAMLEPDAATSVLVLEGRSTTTHALSLRLIPADLGGSGVTVPGTFVGVAYRAP